MTAIKKKGQANPIDVHVGGRLKLRRNLLGLSQQILASKVGITFQQLQKYERGINRIGASRLYELSKVLTIPVEFFFCGIDQSNRDKSFDVAGVYSAMEGSESKLEPENILTRKETADLIRAYYGIDDPKLRKNVLDLAKSLGAALHREQDLIA